MMDSQKFQEDIIKKEGEKLVRKEIKKKLLSYVPYIVAFGSAILAIFVSYLLSNYVL